MSNKKYIGNGLRYYYKFTQGQVVRDETDEAVYLVYQTYAYSEESDKQFISGLNVHGRKVYLGSLKGRAQRKEPSLTLISDKQQIYQFLVKLFPNLPMSTVERYLRYKALSCLSEEEKNMLLLAAIGV